MSLWLISLSINNWIQNQLRGGSGVAMRRGVTIGPYRTCPGMQTSRSKPPLQCPQVYWEIDGMVFMEDCGHPQENRWKRELERVAITAWVFALVIFFYSPFFYSKTCIQLTSDIDALISSWQNFFFRCESCLLNTTSSVRSSRCCRFPRWLCASGFRVVRLIKNYSNHNWVGCSLFLLQPNCITMERKLL